MKKLLLVDGHSLIYRSFFAFVRNPLRNSRGMNTSAVFGFANTLRKMLRDLKPDYCAVVYDAPGKTFRHQRFEAYKIQRPPTPEELPDQIPVIKEMVEAWGLASFEVPGVEADDVLGSLASRFGKRGYEVTVASSDKDMLQLVGSHVSVFDPWKQERYRAEDVTNKLGVKPEQVVDYFALVGDSVDNVPGVPGVGPKRASAMLEKHGSLDRALEQEEKLRAHRDIALLSRELVKIDAEVELDAEPEQLRVGEQDQARLRTVFEEMEFGSLLKELEPEHPERMAAVTEHTDIGWEKAGTVAFCFEPGVGVWLATDQTRVALVQETDRATLKRLLQAPDQVKVGCDVKSQVKALRRAGLELSGPVFDVAVGAWLLDPNRRSYGLPDLMAQVLGRSVRVAEHKGQPCQVLELHQAIEPQLAAMGLETVAEELEMPLISLLAVMEDAGIKVDLAYLRKLEKELGQELGKVKQRVWRLAGVEFNIGSPKQLGQVLFEKLGLPKGKRTKTGHSTSSAVLEELAPQHPVVQEVLQFREMTKLCNTYIRPLIECADPKTQRVHAEFNQTGTGTGRLSSSNPNLQSIPIRTELGRRIRTGFVAESGRKLISADYSQIELRVLAHMAQDDELKQAFERGDDVHTQTAAAVFGLKPGQVTAEHRRMAKVVNYGLIYGMGDFGLSWRMGIPLEQARGFLEEYMGHFAGVAAWREGIVSQALEQGFVRTVSGRIRPVPGVASRNRNVVEAAKRAALNAPIQGSAADIMKRAMLNLAERFRHDRVQGRMLVQVHDELLFEVEADHAKQAELAIREEMEGAWQLDVPLVVAVGTGLNWGEAH